MAYSNRTNIYESTLNLKPKLDECVLLHLLLGKCFTAVAKTFKNLTNLPVFNPSVYLPIYCCYTPYQRCTWPQSIYFTLHSKQLQNLTKQKSNSGLQSVCVPLSLPIILPILPCSQNNYKGELPLNGPGGNNRISTSGVVHMLRCWCWCGCSLLVRWEVDRRCRVCADVWASSWSSLFCSLCCSLLALREAVRLRRVSAALCARAWSSLCCSLLVLWEAALVRRCRVCADVCVSSWRSLCSSLCCSLLVLWEAALVIRPCGAWSFCGAWVSVVEARSGLVRDWGVGMTWAAEAEGKRGQTKKRIAVVLEA